MDLEDEKFIKEEQSDDYKYLLETVPTFTEFIEREF